MSDFKSNFHSKVFNDFKEIDVHAHQSIVTFYTQHEEDIHQLKFDEYFEMQLAYIDALFEITAYENLLTEVDKTIESVIINNIKYYKNEDVYRKLLLKKAATHYNLLEYHKAEYILKELIKIDTNDKFAIQFLKRCRSYRLPFYVHFTRNVSLLLFFLTAIIICFEMFWLGSSTQASTSKSLIEIVRNTIFLSGWAILILGDGIFRLSIFQEVSFFVGSMKQRKVKSPILYLEEKNKS